VAAARVDVELHRLAEGFEHAVKLGAFARGKFSRPSGTREWVFTRPEDVAAVLPSAL
jgi:hypothetical protein